MDWDKVNTPASRRPDPPAPELIDLCARMRGPSKKILSLGVYRNGGMIEVRASYGDEDVVGSERVASIGHGHARCEQWRQSLLAQGSWRELKVDTPRVI